MKTNAILLSVAALAVAGLVLLPASTTGPMTGKPLPELSVQYFKDGDTVTTGKPTLVEFWATWCPPCLKSIPHLNDLNKKYSEKGLQILGITDEDRATVAAFVKDTPMDYHVALDEGSQYAAKFGIRGIPHAFLVDREGKIVWDGHPLALKESDIEPLLK